MSSSTRDLAEFLKNTGPEMLGPSPQQQQQKQGGFFNRLLGSNNKKKPETTKPYVPAGAVNGNGFVLLPSAPPASFSASSVNSYNDSQSSLPPALPSKDMAPAPRQNMNASNSETKRRTVHFEQPRHENDDSDLQSYLNDMRAREAVPQTKSQKRETMFVMPEHAQARPDNFSQPPPSLAQQPRLPPRENSAVVPSQEQKQPSQPQKQDFTSDVLSAIQTLGNNNEQSLANTVEPPSSQDRRRQRPATGYIPMDSSISVQELFAKTTPEPQPRFVSKSKSEGIIVNGGAMKKQRQGKRHNFRVQFSGRDQMIEHEDYIDRDVSPDTDSDASESGAQRRRGVPKKQNQPSGQVINQEPRQAQQRTSSGNTSSSGNRYSVMNLLAANEAVNKEAPQERSVRRQTGKPQDFQMAENMLRDYANEIGSSTPSDSDDDMQTVVVGMSSENTSKIEFPSPHRVAAAPKAITPAKVPRSSSPLRQSIVARNDESVQAKTDPSPDVLKQAIQPPTNNTSPVSSMMSQFRNSPPQSPLPPAPITGKTVTPGPPSPLYVEQSGAAKENVAPVIVPAKVSKPKKKVVKRRHIQIQARPVETTEVDIQTEPIEQPKPEPVIVREDNSELIEQLKQEKELLEELVKNLKEQLEETNNEFEMFSSDAFEKMRKLTEENDFLAHEVRTLKKTVVETQQQPVDEDESSLL